MHTMTQYNKISIIGAGFVGTATARSLAMNNLAREIALVDIKPGFAHGQALDLNHSLAASQSGCRISGGSDFAALEGTELAIVTAGFPRKQGMSRQDLLNVNADIMRGVIQHITQNAPDALILIVSNPVDILTSLVCREFDLSPNKVVGLGGVLDSLRLASYAAELLPVNAGEIKALVIGGHADNMLPLLRFSYVADSTLSSLLDPLQMEKVIEQTRTAGADVIRYRGFSAHEAPASAITLMVETILGKRQAPLSCVTWLDGQYGLQDIALSVPVSLARDQVNNEHELPLDSHELSLLHHSAASIRQAIDKVQQVA